MNDLVCPVCGTEGKSQDYPGEGLFCWDCMCASRGKVLVVRKVDLPVPAEKPKKVRKSA